MGQYSRYVISKVEVQGKNSKSVHEIILAIRHQLNQESSSFQKQPSRSKAFFKIKLPENKSNDLFVGKFVLFKDGKVNKADPEKRKIKPELIDNKVMDEPRFLCFIKNDDVLIAHRYRKNKKDKDEFRSNFDLACNNEYQLTNKEPLPIFQQISRLKQITEIMICMNNKKGNGEATEFIREFYEINFFSRFQEPHTFDKNFQTKIWEEKLAKEKKNQLIQFSKEFQNYLKKIQLKNPNVLLKSI